ncbi:glycoside hydrolase family 65 protein [Halosquirtibacter laminarini]|uniref:Glycoside hydrolase family 65 protein n=1 Tax=Halosquirtibacter laminarini TaxID=3374600 RepID=A0AC61NP92_9BACT|nr:glycoside hydrolase family 65 protein [Prolixibacteraceae bacterium]
MKDFIIHDNWKVIEDQYHPEWNEISESLMSLGNGRMGGRANFEEKFSGKTLQGNYVAGVYYPDKTRVGWWKNGYPDYFAKVLNGANWIGIDITVGEEELDLAECEVLDFHRELDMKEGHLVRRFTAKLPSGKIVEVKSQRFMSIVDSETGAIRYSVKAVNFQDKVTIKPYVDFDVMNKDTNYDEKFWNEVEKEVSNGEGFITAETRKTLFHVTTGMKYQIFIDGEKQSFKADLEERVKYISNITSFDIKEGQTITIEKIGVNLSSEYAEKSDLVDQAKVFLNKAFEKGFDQMLDEHKKAWEVKWETSDIIIEGDAAAQQGIRFNIFQLNQTYTGEDPRLNIGPKGFTGEKYGGSTYWDTEAYCLPFYLATAPEEISKNLLLYRYKHLDRAIENAKKLGFKNGAALYPMVTMNGEECHNEWEITFEEIHRNGAIAFAIYEYIRYTNDFEYLAPYGFEVLLGISRFWTQRVNWSNYQNKYVMLGVTGPNEYENNVDNNYHTNRLAQWTLQYTREAVAYLKENHAAEYASLKEKWNFNEEEEVSKWTHIIDNMYFPYDETRQIFLQQDNFLNKEIIPTAEMGAENRPINQKWSWDRILRSCYIKQADTLQSLYLFEDDFDVETIKRHFDFYEPITVHESSLSPCIHNILASKIGNQEKAYEMYLRTARLDLDDYNNDTEDGLHITSMGGTWMGFVMGFGGFRARNNRLILNPFLPKEWKGYSFKVNFRGAHLKVQTTHDHTIIENISDVACDLTVFDKEYTLAANDTIKL